MQNIPEALQYWLLKTEPDVFSLDDLKAMPRQITPWEGVRNYQARNYMKSMRLGDLAFFYHSSCKEPAIVGVVKVCRLAYPDETSWDKGHPYYDEKAPIPRIPDEARWFKVDVQLFQELPVPITLRQLRSDPFLQSMKLLQKGQRLSVQPVTSAEFHHILRPTH